MTTAQESYKLRDGDQARSALAIRQAGRQALHSTSATAAAIMQIVRRREHPGRMFRILA